MNDPKPAASTLDSFADLPIQPTGSGVADLEIAFEQMKLSEAADATPGSATADIDASPVETSEEAIESAAHPS